MDRRESAAFPVSGNTARYAEVYAGQPEYDNCIEICDKIINSVGTTEFALESNHKDVFRTDNENSKEIYLEESKIAQNAGNQTIKIMEQKINSLFEGMGEISNKSVKELVGPFEDLRDIAKRLKLDKKLVEDYISSKEERVLTEEEKELIN